MSVCFGLDQRVKRANMSRFGPSVSAFVVRITPFASQHAMRIPANVSKSHDDPFLFPLSGQLSAQYPYMDVFARTCGYLLVIDGAIPYLHATSRTWG